MPPGGVQAWLREQGRGFAVGPARVPIVPGAILFDLYNGGDKDWGRYPPYRELGYAAAVARGAGFRARHARRGLRRQHRQPQGRARLGLRADARRRTPSARIVAVNAVGSVTVGDGPHFWAAPFEQGGEFGGRGLAVAVPARRTPIRAQRRQQRENTTIALVATDAALTKPQAKRLAVMAQTVWRARSIRRTRRSTATSCSRRRPAKRPLADPIHGLAELGTVAANVLARADCARRLRGDAPCPSPNALPSWKDRFRVSVIFNP